MGDFIVKNIDLDKKRKAIFMLGIKGKTLSSAVREMIDQYAKEFDEKNSK